MLLYLQLNYLKYKHKFISLRRLCSSTSPGGSANSAFIETTRKKRPSTFLSTAADSYRAVSQSGTASKKSWANFAIRIGGSDSLKKGFERSKSARTLHISANDGSSKRCVLAALFRN